MQIKQEVPTSNITIHSKNSRKISTEIKIRLFLTVLRKSRSIKADYIWHCNRTIVWTAFQQFALDMDLRDTCFQDNWLSMVHRYNHLKKNSIPSRIYVAHVIIAIGSIYFRQAKPIRNTSQVFITQIRNFSFYIKNEFVHRATVIRMASTLHLCVLPASELYL